MFLALIGLSLLTPRAAPAEGKGLSLCGNYRNLLVHSETSAGESWYIDSNRLRIEAKGEPSDSLSYMVKYDNHVAFGDYLSTDEFRAAEAAAGDTPRRTYWDIDEEISRRGQLRWSHSLYRGYLNVKESAVDLKVGRQRIPWGRGWFFSPLDIFNPISPTAIERGEREGVDGVLMEISSGIVTRGAFVYLPQRSVHDTFAARGETLIGSYDVALSIGRHVDIDFYGFDFSGYIGDAGFKGEFVLADVQGRHQENWLLSGNYNFENSLYVMLEYFSNDGGNLHPVEYGGEEYLGVNIGYELTPLTRWDNYLVFNLSDGSSFYSPVISRSVKENLDFSLGIQFFTGGGGDEYGAAEDIRYAEVNWYF